MTKLQPILSIEEVPPGSIRASDGYSGLRDPLSLAIIIACYDRKLPIPVSQGSDIVRGDLIKLLAAEWPELSPGEVEKIVNAFFDAITTRLVDGGRAEIRGFGSFATRARDARAGRNPRTGETVQLTDRRVPWFKAGKDLRELLNGADPRFLGALKLQRPDPPELNDEPVEVSDAELLAEYQSTDGDPADPEVGAIVREIERRGLDI